MAQKVKLLFFLIADPVNVNRVRVDAEIREISHKIRAAPRARSFDLTSELAVRARDLPETLMTHQPAIVHFSGHGLSESIILEDDDGTAKPVPKRQLIELFGSFTDTIRMVVLNACYSVVELQPLSRIIDYTIALNAPISDEAAIIFSSSFY